MKKKFSLNRGNNHFFPESTDSGGHDILLSREDMGTKSQGKYSTRDSLAVVLGENQNKSNNRSILFPGARSVTPNISSP